jgi:hypothetical protein
VNWKPTEVAGLEASDLGEIRGPKGVLKGSNSNGYRMIRFKGRRFYAHRLVFSAWHGNPAGLEVHHKDDDRSNNRPGNLEGLTKGDHKRLHLLKNPLPLGGGGRRALDLEAARDDKGRIIKDSAYYRRRYARRKLSS